MKKHDFKWHNIVGAILILSMLSAMLIGCSTSYEGSSSKEKLQNASYKEVLTRPGAPMLYGDMNEAREFWKGSDRKLVSYVHDEKSVLSMSTGYRFMSQDSIIRSIEINLSEVEDKENIQLDDVLKLICHYIPFNIVSKFYTFDKAIHEIGDTNEYEVYYYLMKINEQGEALRQSGESYLHSDLGITIFRRGDNNWSAELSYLRYTEPRLRWPNEQNNSVEDWDVDIFDYAK